MAHGNQCFGTWENSRLGGVPDGDIEIEEHNGNAIKGTHKLTGFPVKGTCHEWTQSFSRKRTGGGMVHYKDGVITQEGDKYKINGKFGNTDEEESKDSSERGKKKPPPPGDDWTAEKPT